MLARALLRHRSWLAEASLFVACIGVLVSGVFVYVQWHFVDRDGPYQAIAGMVAVDGFAVFVMTVVLIATLLALFLSAGYLHRENLEGPEYYALLLCSATGMMLMASANDLIIVFLALEILSIALYVLAAFDRRRLTSQEAGLKYFLLGSFSSAVFLYGIALVYGATGTTNLTEIADFLATTTLLDDGVLLLGVALMLVGLGVQGRGRAVPHVDARRVPRCADAGHRVHGRRHQGGGVRRDVAGAARRRSSSTASTGGPRSGASPCSRCFVGSVAAVVQTDVKRMLAYSSISHAGYILIGVQAAHARRHERGALLPDGVRADGVRRVRGGHRRRPAR